MSIAPCAPAAPVSGVVVFEPAVFRVQYPEFVTVGDAALQFNFSRATLQLNNSCCSRVSDANLRELLLTLLTAHVTALTNGINGQPAPGVVGRVNSATEGSVSVGSEIAGATFSSAYYLQTKYGLEYWQATARFRQAVYTAPPPRYYGSAGGYAPYNGGSA